MPVCATCGTAYPSTVRICVRDGTPLVADAADDPYLGTLLDGKYRIDAFINAGGMGSLYRALHVMLDKTVAVKVIKNELVTSDEIVARFQREARAASNLHHPNIVSIYDLGQTSDGRLYIAMEFIDGPSLRQVIRQNGPLTPGQSIDMLRQVASALSSAHRKQIVHRDLKSDNLMLASEDGRKVVKLVDFGIAKTFDDSTQLTAAGFMLGTPRYMSPEQAAGKPVDHRADLYSLGVILYEMLTGDVPFGDAALTSMLVRLATEVPPPPSSRCPDGRVPPALDAVAMRCLEKDPDERFQSADEFAAALERASAEVDTSPAPSQTSIPTVQATLVRPAEARAVATRRTDSTPSVPSASTSAGLETAASSKQRIGPPLLVVGAATVAVVSGVLLWNNRHQAIRPSTTNQQQAASSVPAPAQPTQVPVQALPAQPQPPAAVKPPALSVVRPPLDVNPPRSQTVVNQTPPAPAPVTASTPATAPAPGVPARTLGPSVLVTCQGAPDVCDAMRSELLRALQADAFSVSATQATADIVVAVNVVPLSESPSTQFGTPSIVRTYSVELSGNSHGKPLVMPAKRVFGFDAVFGRPVLQENARQIASGTVEAVRAFTAKGKN